MFFAVTPVMFYTGVHCFQAFVGCRTCSARLLLYAFFGIQKLRAGIGCYFFIPKKIQPNSSPLKYIRVFSIPLLFFVSYHLKFLNYQPVVFHFILPFYFLQKTVNKYILYFSLHNSVKNAILHFLTS